jgi:hypothetical protein
MVPQMVTLTLPGGGRCSGRSALRRFSAVEVGGREGLSLSLLHARRRVGCECDEQSVKSLFN